MMFRDLKGKTLESAKLVQDELHLTVDGKLVRFLAVGDCCSRGWISDLHAPALPTTIVQVVDDAGNGESVEEGQPGFPEDGEVVYVYPSKIETTAGDVTFKVWNDSNGYYGSVLECVESP